MAVKVEVVKLLELSTPHGALGTCRTEEIHCKATVLSTPHGALGTYNLMADFISLHKEELSTPHGALGTPKSLFHFRDRQYTFNSTRCIRNGL